MADVPVTYWERRRAGEFERVAAERAAELAAQAVPAVEAASDERRHIPIGSDVELDDAIDAGAGAGGASSLTDLTDVTGDPGPNKSPVYDGDTGMAPLTEVPTQEDLDAILLSRPWHKVRAFDGVWQPSNPTVVITPDGIRFGPYADGQAAGGSVRYLGLNGQPMTACRNLAFNIRYLEDGMHAEYSPYLRIFTQDAQGAPHDAIFTPGSQVYTGLGCGPSQEFVATSGMWRYDSDDGSDSEFGTGVPLAEILAKYGAHTITKIGITLGFTGGVNLVGLLRWWQINSAAYLFLAE